MNQSQEIKEKLVAINRITKVVKGGRRFGFAALVVVGNQKAKLVLDKEKQNRYQMLLKKLLKLQKNQS